MNRNPLLTQHGIVSNGSIVFNNIKPSNRTISGVSSIYISDVFQQNMPTKTVQYGYQNNSSMIGNSYFGYQAGQTGFAQYAVAMGYQAGQINQATGAVAIGYQAGQTNQSYGAVAIGMAGALNQGDSAIAIGRWAGLVSQGDNTVAIGNNCGHFSQGGSSVAIGVQCGYTGQGSNSVAVGNGAGQYRQQSNAVAFGNGAGRTGQGTNAIAIGQNAGQTAQGSYSIAIGSNITCTVANSIYLNATSTSATAITSSAFYVNPVRGHSGVTGGVLLYTFDKEIASNPELFYSSSGLFVKSTYTTSDYRIKQFVQTLPSQYNVDLLKPVHYYNTSANKTDLGFIAHEVQQHFPMLVSGIKDGPENQSINYIGLIPVLVAEVQDLKSQIKTLKLQLQTISDIMGL